MRATKILLMSLVLNGALSVSPVPMASAGTFDGALFSVQDRNFGGHKGGFDKRQFRESRSAPLPPPDRGRGNRGHLTEEERRQLHRDLDKANRELYGGRGR